MPNTFAHAAAKFVKLFHRDVFMPAHLAAPLCRETYPYSLHYTRHAMLECVRDRYGAITQPPRSLCFTESNIVELEAIDGEVTKLVVRVPYDRCRDLILVLCDFDGSKANVKTAWTCLKTDTHVTLDRSKYATDYTQN